jgi:hypothetical protein
VNTASPSRAPHFWWGKISLLWLLLTPLVVAAYTLLLPIAPNDFWYNARAGAHIATTGHIPTTALFTTSVASATPYFNQAWIAQWLLFGTLKTGGLTGIILLRTLCLTVAFALILAASRRRIERLNQTHNAYLSEVALARIAGGSTLAAFMLSASNMDIRPQTFSVPLFALFVFCILEWPFLSASGRKATLVFLVVCMALWANVHGAFFTGLILLGALLAGQTLQFFWTRKSVFCARVFGEVSRAQLFQTALLFGLAAIAALLNPRGAALYGYVFKLAALQTGQKYIQEWQAPSLADWYGALFFVALALALLMMGVLLNRLRAEEKAPLGIGAAMPRFGLSLGEVFIFGITALMALRDIRSIIWFALFFAPVLAALTLGVLTRSVLTRGVLPVRTAKARQFVSIPLAAQVANAVIALCLIFSLIFFLPQMRHTLPLPRAYFSQFAPTPRGAFPYGFDGDFKFLLERNTPVEAAQYLRAHPPRGKVWNDMVFGSYLTWAGFPDILPSADPRVELYPPEFWEEYARLTSGPPDAAQTLRAQNFSAALLHRRDERQLLRRLQRDGWHVVSSHRNVVLLLAPRANGKP